MDRKRTLIAGAAVLIVALAAALTASFAPASLPESTNVYVDPRQSSCKGGSTFSCTIVLEARGGNLDASFVKSVQINGTNPESSVTAEGGSVTIFATLPSVTMQHGLADIGPAIKPPQVGSVVVDLSDGTAVSVLLGPSGILH